MDTTRFDDLARRLGGASTRRAGLKAALGGLLGLAALVPPGETPARKRRKSKLAPRCGPDKPCPEGQTCDGEGTPGARCVCDGGARPCGGRCCPAGQECDSDSGNPRCRCASDGRHPCGDACCPADQVCFVDRCQACSRPAGPCQLDLHCCADARCDAGRCCQPKGAACSSSGQCCNPDRNACRNGRCEQATGGGNG